MRLTHCCGAAEYLLQSSEQAYFDVIKPIPGLLQQYEGITPMFLAKLIRLFRAWRGYARSVRELSSLSDRELADIGVHRSEIPAVARAYAGRSHRVS